MPLTLVVQLWPSVPVNTGRGFHNDALWRRRVIFSLLRLHQVTTAAVSMQVWKSKRAIRSL